MTSDANKVVFVGVPDLVELSGVSKSYMSRIAKSAGRPGAKLPRADALINAKPAWRLSEVLPVLDGEGYEISDVAIEALSSERAVSQGFVPVGTAEGAEVIGLTVPAFRARHYKGTLIPPAFHIGSLALVWDLNALVTYARANGDNVDEEALKRWCARNGTGTPVQRQAVAVIRVAASIVSHDLETAEIWLSNYVKERLTDVPSPESHIVVTDAKVQSVDIRPSHGA